MPDNDFFDNLDDHIDEAARATDAKLAVIAANTRLKESEIAALFPSKENKERFVELVELVSDATSHNEKATKFADNIGRLGDVSVKLLSKLLLA